MKQLSSSTNEPHSLSPPCPSAVSAASSPDMCLLLYPRQSGVVFRTQLRPWFTKQVNSGGFPEPPSLAATPQPRCPLCFLHHSRFPCAAIVSVFLPSPFCFSSQKCKMNPSKTMRASAGPRISTRSGVPFATPPLVALSYNTSPQYIVSCWERKLGSENYLRNETSLTQKVLKIAQRDYF